MKRFIFSAVALSALVASPVLAQGQGTRPAQRPNQAQGGQAQGGQTQSQAGAQRPQGSQGAQQLDQHAAACLLIGNQEEIALSEFGIERAQSDDVKEFAREMVKDHAKMVSKLRKFTPQSGSFELKVKVDDASAKRGAKAEDTEAARTGEAESATRSGETTTAKAASGGSMQDQLLAIKRDKAQQCLNLTKQNLQEHQGAHFDKAFVGTQVSAHISMLAELRALKGKVSGEFAELVKEAEEATQMHLDHAKKLMEEQASAAGSEREERGASRPASETQRNRGDRNERNPAPRGDRPAPRREG